MKEGIIRLYGEYKHFGFQEWTCFHALEQVVPLNKIVGIPLAERRAAEHLDKCLEKFSGFHCWAPIHFIRLRNCNYISVKEFNKINIPEWLNSDDD